VIEPLVFDCRGKWPFDLIMWIVDRPQFTLACVEVWRFLTAEIAAQDRLTLLINQFGKNPCGKNLVTGYNLANGFFFCFLGRGE